MVTSDDGTIDITNIVSAMKDTFVLSGKDYILALALAVPGIGPVAAWFIKVFLGPFISWALRKLSDWAVMQAFFMNTAIRKASQAIDYETAVNAKNNLPPTATDAEYERAERAEILAFNNFVRVTN